MWSAFISNIFRWSFICILIYRHNYHLTSFNYHHNVLTIYFDFDWLCCFCFYTSRPYKGSYKVTGILCGQHSFQISFVDRFSAFWYFVITDHLTSFNYHHNVLTIYFDFDWLYCFSFYTSRPYRGFYKVTGIFCGQHSFQTSLVDRLSAFWYFGITII